MYHYHSKHYIIQSHISINHMYKYYAMQHLPSFVFQMTMPCTSSVLQSVSRSSLRPSITNTSAMVSRISAWWSGYLILFARYSWRGTTLSICGLGYGTASGAIWGSRLLEWRRDMVQVSLYWFWHSQVYLAPSQPSVTLIMVIIMMIVKCIHDSSSASIIY